MPPFPTTPCFASRPSPDTTTTIPSPLLLHPAMEFMHSFVHSWCETHTAHSKPYTEWFTPDFELGSHDGRRFRGETAARAFVESMRGYERSTVEIDAVYLEEVEGGYQGLAMGRIFLDFVVAGGKGEGEKEGEKTCVDGEGMGWDFCVPRAYDCAFVRDPSGPVAGLKLSKMLVCGDLQVVAAAAEKRALVH